MLRVGVTGGIAAGKSTVVARLAELGAVVVDSDALAREVLAPGAPAVADVVEAFGSEVLSGAGVVDRARLGHVVFGDPQARARLEAITHPRIQAMTAQRFADAPGHAVVVHDIPLLVELGMADRYHLVVVVGAPETERVRRLVTERGMTEAEARGRVAAQATDADRRRAADVWLDNGEPGGVADLRARVDLLWRERLAPFESNVRLGVPVRPPLPVHLADADPTWEAVGHRLASRVRRAAGGAALAVDHVGSTAVAGLAAKDVIDLQLTVADLDTGDGIADRLRQAGFPRVADVVHDEPKPDDPDPAHWGKLLHAGADPGRPVYVHVREAGSPGARYAVLFRDWLRADARARADYETEKRRLVRRHAERPEYSAAKEPWLAEVAHPRMRAWAAAVGWTWP